MAHDHHGHDHGHHHHHAPPAGGLDRRYLIGIVLNLGFVAAEAAAGFLAHSTALLADASHNLSDVLGLALAAGAAWLAKRPATEARTYGFGKATILAALGNGLMLVFACGALALEAARRFADPAPIETGMVMAVAAVGVLVNGATAMLFFRHGDDMNARGAFLHMAADAAVSAGVIVAALVIGATGWLWIDPTASLVIIVIILAGTWGLLKDAFNLALDAAPRSVDVAQVRAMLEAQDGVTDVHDLHVWAMSTTEHALTAHVVRPDRNDDDAFLKTVCHELDHAFGIDHVTLQIERGALTGCPTH
jgi:cobalt-zinc-cadmium efflux system protein